MSAHSTSGPEPAVSAGDDPRHYARLLSAVYDATMTGGRAPARPRSVISESWGRARDAGVDPDVGPTDPGGSGDIDGWRQQSGLAPVLEDLTRGLDSVTSDGDNILIVSDATGRVLWRHGAVRVLHSADRLGFMEGADWSEKSVGTNAIGTALASERAVQVFSAEHYVRTHHSWTCAGAPIRDPRTDDVLGVVDVSGPADTIHPTTVALVDVVARLATAQLRDRHRRTLDRLRAIAAPILARSTGPAVVVDDAGWVAALDHVTPHTRIVLPRVLTPGRVLLGDLGECDLEPLPGGWLITPTQDREPSGRIRVEVDVREPDRPVVRITGSAGGWMHRPSPRHTQILLLLAAHRDGRTAAQLSSDLFGRADRTITVRAEMSRLRKHFGSLIAAGPYRFVDAADVTVGSADTSTA